MYSRVEYDSNIYSKHYSALQAISASAAPDVHTQYVGNVIALHRGPNNVRKENTQVM